MQKEGAEMLGKVETEGGQNDPKGTVWWAGAQRQQSPWRLKFSMVSASYALSMPNHSHQGSTMDPTKMFPTSLPFLWQGKEPTKPLQVSIAYKIKSKVLSLCFKIQTAFLPQLLWTFYPVENTALPSHRWLFALHPPCTLFVHTNPCWL